MEMIQAIIETLNSSETTKVKVAIADIDGILRGKYLSVEKFLSVLKGELGFCNVIFGWDSSDVCYDNSKYTGWHSGYPDALVKIDPSTSRRIPWDNDVPFFLGDFVDASGTGLEICPRQSLKRILARMTGAGYLPKVGMEFEWFNFKETPDSLKNKSYAAEKIESLSPGMFGYSVIRMNQNQPFFNALFDDLNKFNIPLEGLHTETGPGVMEAAILFSGALEAADRAILFKTAAREIGHRFGIMPSFMAKWNTALPGCSGHIHQSLWDMDENRNIFYDETDKNKMSPVFKNFLAGVIHCLPEFLPFYAPTVNSYKRLVEGFWAPTRANWGIDNRTVACRVIPGSSNSTRMELRVSGSDVNPYLAVAATLASGLYGIEKKLELKNPPVTGNGYAEKNSERLPANLFEAAKKLSKSEIAKEMFGANFVEHFAETRFWEWKKCQESVTDWEIKRYFEII